MVSLLAVLALHAQAAPLAEFDFVEPVGWRVPVDLYDELLEEAAGQSPEAAVGVEVFAIGPDGVRRPMSAYLPAPPPVERKEPWTRGGPMPADIPGNTQGFLSGKATYLSQAHGFIWFDTLGRFSTQRGILFNTVEDFHNAEGMNQYLASYLENAGARVFAARERDMQTEQAIVDDGDAGYTEQGSGFASGANGFGKAAHYSYNENPFRAGSVRTFPADPGNVARWSVTVPQDGWYNVYVSWKSGSTNALNATYTLTTASQTVVHTYDQLHHGSTWQYVENLWLPEGPNGLVVELSVPVAEPGRQLVADAVRIGGGMGDVWRHSQSTGEPRWSEGAILYNQYNGAPASVYDPYGSGDGSDPTTRARWAAWEQAPGEDAIYLSWHSNAGGGQGTSTYTWQEDARPEATGSSDLGDAVHDELVSAMRALWSPTWKDRGRQVAHFAEVNPANNPTMPAALVELAFHDDAADTELLKHPELRRDAARAMYRGIVRYYAQKDGTTARYLPEPPTHAALRHNSSGALELSWAAGVSGDPFGDAATSYVIYTSPDGRSWDAGTDVGSATRARLDAVPGELLFARVAGVNAGGVSFPSEVVGAMRSGDGTTPILVVDAFDRLDVGTLLTASTSIGSVVRMDLRHMNAYDTTVAHGLAIADAGWPFETVTDEVFDGVSLADKRLVVWNAGEESTTDESFSGAQQQALRAFVSGGGALWASGSEVLWDLDARGGTSDKAFAAEVLGATMASDDAGTHVVSGEGALAGVGPMDFDNNIYAVEWPDALATSRPVVARYSGGQPAALLGDGVFFMGYPFETIASESTRAEIARVVLPELVPGYTPPDVGTDPGTDPGTDTDTGTGTDTDAGTDTTAGGWRRVPRSSISGCGCQSGVGGGMGWALLLPLLALRRRESRG